MSNLLSNAGLFLGMAGALILGFVSTGPLEVTMTVFGDRDEHGGDPRNGTKGAQIEPRSEDRRWIQAGWWLLGLGFFLQLVG